MKQLFMLLSTYFSPRWVSRKEEKEFCNTWDAIYAKIRQQKREREEIVQVPSDTELYRFSVVTKVRSEHKVTSSVRV